LGPLILATSMSADSQPSQASLRPVAADNGQSADAQYLRLSADAMQAMMRQMQTPSHGDVDRDFVAQMVPHHQGAIAMAVAMLRFGRNQQLRRLAQEIIVTQRQEIEAMRLAVGESAGNTLLGAIHL
jgi:uncharacterized protein (DUF305 family)